MLNPSDTGVPVIDVVGPTTHNKGDQMMLAAIRAQFEPACRTRCLDGGVRSYRARQLLLGTARRLPIGGLLRKSYYRVAPLLPETARARLQLTGYARIAATLDCSGYLYGDPWGHVIRQSVWRLDHYRRVRQRGRPVIFMPQAFGPFADTGTAARVRAILEQGDLIACRDRRSLAYVHELGVRDERVRFVPDITILAPPIPPDDPAAWAETVAIVPNLRMLDKTGQADAQSYIGFVLGLIERIGKRGLRPVLLLHETFDDKLAATIVRESGRPVDVVNLDPLRAKGVIGACRAVLSSRFHAIVSSLTQATPCLGTAWTHKYRELFEDYEWQDGLLPVDAPDGEIDAKLDMILDDPSRAMVVERLRARAKWHRDQVLGFWAVMDGLITQSQAQADAHAVALPT